MATVIVRGLNGEALATACSTFDADGQAVFLDRVTVGKGRLLCYYFGEGNRAVVLEGEDFRLRGILRTAWMDGERRWRVLPSAPWLGGREETPLPDCLAANLLDGAGPAGVGRCPAQFSLAKDAARNHASKVMLTAPGGRP